jgi:hypothetical protein
MLMPPRCLAVSGRLWERVKAQIQPVSNIVGFQPSAGVANMRKMDWFADDDKFVSRLKTGHQYAEYAAERLTQRGLHVEITPLEIREDIEARHRFADEFDLRVGEGLHIVDVKSRTLKFSGPGDYPYATAFVDTVSSWERKTHKPCAIVLVSQPTGGLAVIRASTRPQWTRSWRYDHDRRIWDWFFEVSCDELATFDQFVDWLHAQQERSMAA